MIKHTNPSRRTLLKVAAGSALAVGTGIPADANACSRVFPVFDALLYRNKPDLTAQSLCSILLAYQSDLWPSGVDISTVPSRAQIQTIVQQATKNGGRLILDIEGDEWPMYGVSSSVELASIAKFQALRTVVGQISPALQVGVYSAVPRRDYWRAIAGPASTDYQQWQAENTGAIAVAQAMDVLYPSLYTFYSDQSEWVKYATANISEARRLAQGKPVIPVLWPQYHDATSLAYQFIDPTYWQLQLNTCHQLADGVVLWGGVKAGGYLTWDNTAAWWIATQNFVNSVG